MCGIVGIYRRTGLTAEDIQRFKGMITRCEVRGDHASGVFNSDMSFFKAPIPSSQFVKLRKVIDLLDGSVGCKYIVGHTRFATRGDPRMNINNHPVFDKKRRHFLVHNGCVEYGTKFDKHPENTDTWILMYGIAHYSKKMKRMPYFDVVKAAFNDITLNGDNSSAIVTGNNKQLVFARSEDRPLSFQFINDDLFYFASTADIIGLESNGKDKKGIEKRVWFDLGKYSACAVNLESGKFESEVLECYPRPVALVRHSKDAYFNGSAWWNANAGTLAAKPPEIKVNGEIKSSTEGLEGCFDRTGESPDNVTSQKDTARFDCRDCLYCDFDSMCPDETEDGDEGIYADRVYCTSRDGYVMVGECDGCSEFVHESFGGI